MHEHLNSHNYMLVYMPLCILNLNICIIHCVYVHNHIHSSNSQIKSFQPKKTIYGKLLEKYCVGPIEE